MADGAETNPSIDRTEHIDENISAKRVGNYVWDGSNWQRMTQPGGSGGGDGAILDGVSSSIKATVKNYTNSKPLTVVTVDTNGDYVAGAGGTQYADGAVRGTATGTLSMGDDGTNIQSVRVDSSGVLAIQDNGGSITVDGTVIANAGTNLNTSALALDATLTTSNTRLGDITETAPASDTASSGLNGRLQRIAQRLTSIIALLPASLGQKARASSLAVTLSTEDMTALTPSSPATSTLQTTGNTSLASIATNTTRPTIITERVSNTDGASTALSNLGALASNFNYIYAISVFRTDAGTTPIYVDFRDGTAGSILYSVVLPPNGGAVIANSWDSPLFRTSVNTALAYDVSAATTTVFISVTGFRSTT